MIEHKSIEYQNNILGQFMTPESLSSLLLKDYEIKSDVLYIEPSYGLGSFIKALLDKGVDINNISGCELDGYLFQICNYKSSNLINTNFYNYQISSNKKLVFIGNPPFRTPALSLTTHREEVKGLVKYYSISGIREEAVFFFLKTLKLIEDNNTGGEIHYILPKTILTNNSKFYSKFQSLIQEKFKILSIKDLEPNIFNNTALELVFLSLEYQPNPLKIKLNTQEKYWDYRNIFKTTHLGSVPCESTFVSSTDENIEHFQQRLLKMFNEPFHNLDSNLRYKGKAHLSVLNKNNKDLLNKKLKIIWNYISEIKEMYGGEFNKYLNDISNYKPINHRNEIRFYFRHPSIKKCSFVYNLNPNPQPSFYFTGNPSKLSTDYMGYCDFDVTCNSSPGACRTIPLSTLNDNIKPEFKEWWDKNIQKDYKFIFKVFQNVINTEWYKNMKKKYNRFYFGIPSDKKAF